MAPEDYRGCGISIAIRILLRQIAKSDLGS